MREGGEHGVGPEARVTGWTDHGDSARLSRG